MSGYGKRRSDDSRVLYPSKLPENTPMAISEYSPISVRLSNPDVSLIHYVPQMLHEFHQETSFQLKMLSVRITPAILTVAWRSGASHRVMTLLQTRHVPEASCSSIRLSLSVSYAAVAPPRLVPCRVLMVSYVSFLSIPWFKSSFHSIEYRIYVGANSLYGYIFLLLPKCLIVSAEWLVCYLSSY